MNILWIVGVKKWIVCFFFVINEYIKSKNYKVDVSKNKKKNKILMIK